MTETSGGPAILKARLRTDLTAAMKARDGLTTGTIRMALAAITNAEVSGTTAKELTDAEVAAVLGKEIRKRNEAAEAFAGAGRAEQAAKEQAEAAVLQAYLPTPLTDDEVGGIGGLGDRRGCRRHRCAGDHATDGPGHQAGAGQCGRSS